MFTHHRAFARAAMVTTLILGLSLCLSCASVMRRTDAAAQDQRTVLGVQHAHSEKSSDCLSVCVGMVLQYYDVPAMAPDTVLPLELVSVSRQLNSGITADEDGHVLFSTVLEMGPDEIAAHLAAQRPLIMAFKPSARAEYHSIVVSGYGAADERFLIQDPSRRKPAWKKLSKFPPYNDTGKYLVLLIGIREQ
jgi:hypothetical protein